MRGMGGRVFQEQQAFRRRILESTFTTFSVLPFCGRKERRWRRRGGEEEEQEEGGREGEGGGGGAGEEEQEEEEEEEVILSNNICTIRMRSFWPLPG